MATRTKQGKYTKSPLQKGTDERTGAQHAGREIIPGWAGQFFYGNGGTLDNPMAFPGYDKLYTGTTQTYRWMLQHPILRLVRSIATGAVIASTWEYEADTGVETSIVDAVERTFDRLRPEMMDDFYVRGRDYGWVTGEPIWRFDGSLGIDDLVRVKPLLNEVTTILQDDHGNFDGLRNQVSVGTSGAAPDLLPAPYKAWKFTYDGEAGYHHGRSWLENVRATAWKDWLDCAQQLQRLGTKISGVSTIIKSPAGTFPGPIGSDGKPTTISYAKNAEIAIKALAAGAAGVWFPSLGIAPDTKGNLDAMKVLIELAGKSLTTIEVVDHSGNSQAIDPILKRMIHAEELMFAGGLRSARTGLQGQHGTKEEAGIHTQTGDTNAEAEDGNFARQCQPLLDAFVSVNWSPNLAGRIRIKTPSLVDRKTAILKALILALINIPEIAVEIAKTTNMDKLLDALDVTRSTNFDTKSMEQAIKESRASKNAPKNDNKDKKRKKNPSPQGGRPKA